MNIAQRLKRPALLLAVILVSLRLFTGCVELRYSDAAYEDDFQDSPHPFQIHYDTLPDRVVRYLEVGADTLPVTILVHGSPSSSLGWNRYLHDSALLHHTRLVAVDRPGYGYSGFGKPVLSAIEQADMLEPMLQRYHRQQVPIVLVSSSYGGPAVARMAMDHPEWINGIVFINSSLAPGEEYTYPISYWIEKPWFGWLLPKVLRVANKEKLGHRGVLEELLPGWKNITAPTTILHGKADELIYFSNATFAQEKLVNAQSVELIALPGTDHGIPWSHPTLVSQAILKHVNGTPISQEFKAND